MSDKPALSYSAALGGTQTAQTPGTTSQAMNASSGSSRSDKRRSPSPAHIPQTSSSGEDVYVLTLLTDKPHHKALTSMRKKYFPPRINKLDAHLTLFHALPGSKLQSDILPVLISVASNTTSFRVHAAQPFRMKKGIAISVPKHEGGQQAQQIHKALQRPWLEAGFLSEQDQGGCRVHYTIMNKVDDEGEVAKAMKEVEESWPGNWGTVDGLGLWRYAKGFWRWEKAFTFRDVDGKEQV